MVDETCGVPQGTEERLETLSNAEPCLRRNGRLVLHRLIHGTFMSHLNQQEGLKIESYDIKIHLGNLFCRQTRDQRVPMHCGLNFFVYRNIGNE